MDKKTEWYYVEEQLKKMSKEELIEKIQELVSSNNHYYRLLESEKMRK